MPPRRIVSLVPSQTELLFDIGLEEQMVGVTRFCVHPARARRQCRSVGGTKGVKIDRVLALRPDLVVANREENLASDVAELEQQVPVWVSDVRDLPSALAMIRGLGKVTGRERQGDAIAADIEGQFAGFRPDRRRSVCYLIWRDPYMAAGSDTFIHDLLTRVGWHNVLHDTPRYPAVTAESLREHRPDLLLAASEPFPFGPRHRAELEALSPGAQVLFVDGELFSWYGSRLSRTLSYIHELQRGLP